MCLFSTAGSGSYCTCPRFYSSNQATAVCFLGDVWYRCFLYHQRIIQESCNLRLYQCKFCGTYFDNPALYSGVENLFGVYGYALQIYCDFSGYSDMAIGLALLLGFRFPMNFNSPYKADSITDFWHRWHISLSTWLRDYLYISLGGNRKGKARTYINLCLTMLLGGLWHGASWNFVIWGGFHGIALAAQKFWRNLLHKPKTATSKGIRKFLQFLLLSILFVSAGYFSVIRLLKLRLLC